MDRRGFLRALGVGMSALVAPRVVLAEPEPVRRNWPAAGSAPVGPLRGPVPRFDPAQGDAQMTLIKDGALFGIDAQPYGLWAGEPTIITGIE